MKIDVLLITALKLEFEAVCEFINDGKDEPHTETGSIYYVGTYTSGATKYRVALVEAGAGNIKAVEETGRAIAYFKPDYAFFVGVAGGIKDVKLGDVVASSYTVNYEVGKEEEEHKPRGQGIPASYKLEQLAKHVSRKQEWNEVSEVKPIAVGEKVVASTRSTAYAWIKKYYSDCVAIDMEGTGFLYAARPYPVHAIEVRGISDLLDGKEAADSGGSQPVAARNAAAFAFEMVDNIVMLKGKNDLSDPDFRKEIVAAFTEMYEQGPDMDNIWKRAGGDNAVFTNYASRKSQWFTAIELLSKGGGGGDVTFDKLLAEAAMDFPNNSFIRKINAHEK